MAARVRPSGLSLTVPCPGSLSLQEQTELLYGPTIETREQAEGSVAHIVAMKHGQGLGAEWGVGRTLEYNGTTWTVDDDMVDGAIMYKNEAQINGRFEETVAIPDVHPTECAGTPDWWHCWMDAVLKLLKVIDYKYGHRYVEVWEHWQLVAYAAGIARFLNLPLDFPVKLVIVQPRCYTGAPVREWPTTVEVIYKLCADRIAPAARLALEPNPPTLTGRHCIDCRARDKCKTLQYSNANIVDFIGTAELSHMSDDAVGQELRILKAAQKQLEARYTGLYERANHLARAGTRIAYWSLEPTRGKYDWLPETPVDNVAAMGDMVNVNLRKPLKLLTPTQAIDAGIDASIIAMYAKRFNGATRLVEDDATKLRKIFGDNAT